MDSVDLEVLKRSAEWIDEGKRPRIQLGKCFVGDLAQQPQPRLRRNLRSIGAPPPGQHQVDRMLTAHCPPGAVRWRGPDCTCCRR